MFLNKNLNAVSVLIIGIFIVFNYQFIQAQSSTGIPTTTDTVTTSESTSEPAPASTGTVKQTTAVETRPVETSPKVEEPIVMEGLPQTQTPILSPNTEEQNNFGIKDLAIVLGAMLVAGLTAFKLNTRNTPENKSKRKEKRCAHVGAIIEANLREMTSLEEKIEDMAINKLEINKLAKILISLKNKHEKYSKLFEECIIKTDDKKKIFTIHSDEAKSWANQFGEKAKKMGFEHESVHISNPKVLDIVKKAGKNTLFIIPDNSHNVISEHLKDMEKEHIISNNMGEIVEKLESFGR